MTRLYFEPIRVRCEGENPITFIWRQSRHRIIAIPRRWVVRIDWWRQEVIRQYYKVECEDLGTYEIYRERGLWFLERTYD